jgi:hypothetical protein
MGAINRKRGTDHLIKMLNNVRSRCALENFDCGKNTELVKKEMHLYLQQDTVAIVDAILQYVNGDSNVAQTKWAETL